MRRSSHLHHWATLKSRSFSVLCLCLAVLCETAGAEVYYVSSTQGSASNPGTIASPWTLEKAKSTARAGDVVNLLAGDYPATTFGAPDHAAGTPGQWITYQSYPNPWDARFSSVTFQGGRSLHIKIAGFEVECLSGQSGVQVVSNTSDVIIKDCKIHGQPEGNGPSFANVSISSAKNVVVEGCEIYYSGRSGYGVHLGTSQDVVVRRCHIHDIVTSAIKTGGGGPYIIEYNRIHDQREDWNPEAHGSGISVHSHYTTIRGNVIYNYGNTRPIRFYQSWAGPEGYHDMLVENNLVFKTPGYPRTMWWVEFIDVGPRCVIRNNTFVQSCWIYFAQNADGSGLSLHNNIFAGGLTLDNYGTTGTLRSQTSQQSRAKWDLVSEGNNFYRSLNANGCGYMCPFPKFSETSNSPIGNASYFSVGSFFESNTGEYPYQLAQNSPAIGSADPANASQLDLFGQTRDIVPDAGCYEYTGVVGNRSPVLTAIGSQQATVGISLTLQIAGADPDGDPMEFTASGLPAGAAFSQQTFTWTPAAGQIGAYQVTFTVSDGQVQDSETITITVGLPNAAPILADIGNKTTDENQTLSFSINATDADGDPLTYSASGMPNGASFAGQTFTWTPGFSQAGTHSVTFTASDGKTQNSRTIIISVANVNRPPALAAIGDRSIDESNTLTLALSGADPDGTGLTYSATGLPAGANLSGQNFTWTPAAGQTGSHEITFAVSDGTLTDSETITVMVVNPSADHVGPVVARHAPAPGAIQVPLNNLITFHVTDAGKGVNPASVTIMVDGKIVYQGDSPVYTSTFGKCTRSGVKNDYQFLYQNSQMFDFDHEVLVTVNAADLAGNVMNPSTYSFGTEMRAFGSNKRVSKTSTVAKGGPVTVGDAAGNIWAAWHAGPVGARDIYVARLPAGQDAFENPVQITRDVRDQCNPDLALAANGALYVVWQDDRQGHWDIFASVSGNGQTFSKETVVTDANDNQTAPAVAVDSGSPNRITVAWQDDRSGNQDIYVASSTNAFASVTATRVTANAADQTEPDLAVGAAGTIYLAWTDERNGQADIYGATSTASWANVPLATGPGDQTSPAVAADGSVLHLLWVDDASGDSDIHYASSNGLPADPMIGVNIIDDTSGAAQTAPALACAGNGKVFACWQDARNVGLYGTDTDVYFAELSSGGVKTNILVGDGGAEAGQSEPAIALSTDGQPYIAWTDDRNTVTEIYSAATTYVDPTPLHSTVVAAASGATVGTAPTAISGPDDVSIVVPAGACQTDLRVTISRILNPLVSPGDCLGSYDFGPSGIEFGQPVTVTIPYRVAIANRQARAYWYNSLTGALSQQGITDIENITINGNLYALRFKTTHFTPYYLVASDSEIAASGSSGGGGGGCSMSLTGDGSPEHLLVPYAIVAVAMAILRRRDRKRAMRNAEL